MNLLIKNVDAIVLDEAGTILRGTTIAIQGRVITAIGEIPEGVSWDEVIDSNHLVAVPGFFNAHCHASMTLVRGWAEDLPLDRWFNEKIWVAESALTAEGVYWGAALAACEMIRSGCVGFNDHYFYMDRVSEVIEASGMKAALTWCQFGIGDDKEVGANLPGALAFADRWHNQADGRIKAALGPHSPYVCPPAFLRQISDLAREHGLPLHIHLAESPEQVETSRKAHGKSPTEHLEACGVFDVPCLAAHAIYLSDADIAILARHQVTVAHCPITYLKLAMGINDLERLQRAGVPVALGTDGPASNNDMDMKAVIRFAALMQKHQRTNAEALPGDLPLRMASGVGARALGFANSGSIEVGKAADIALFDFAQPHLVPRHNLTANLVHAARGGDVRHLIIDGKLVMKDRRILTLDEEKILAEAERCAFQMVGQPLRTLREYKG
jgi:5-methylthioadenosine/S-adenosylhomocysteine deaminase